MKLEEVYARALDSSIRGGIKAEDVLPRLVTILKRRGHIKLLPKIARNLERLLEQHTRTKTANVRVAKKTHEEKYKKEIDNARRELGLEKATTVLDETLIGGYVVEGGSKMIDASYKTALLKLYRTFIS